MLASINRVKEIIKKRQKPVAAKVTKKADIDFPTYIQMVEKKAYELYEKHGCRHGHDQEDWDEARNLIEQELRKS